MMAKSIFLTLLLLFSIRPLMAQNGSSIQYEKDKPQSSPAQNKSYRRKKPVIPSKSPLGFTWRVFRNTTQGPQETNPFQTFHVGDQIQIEIVPLTEGYLYVLLESETISGKPLNSPTLIFPDSRIKFGGNLVQKGQPVYLPLWCGTPSQRNCWMTLTPPSGTEKFTILFSKTLLSKILKDNTELDRTELTRYQVEYKGIRRSNLKGSAAPLIDRNQLSSAYSILVQSQPNSTEVCEHIILQLSTENGSLTPN